MGRQGVPGGIHSLAGGEGLGQPRRAVCASLGWGTQQDWAGALGAAAAEQQGLEVSGAAEPPSREALPGAEFGACREPSAAKASAAEGGSLQCQKVGQVSKFS